MNPKILILDFDGIVLESNEVKDQAFKEIFGRFPKHFDAMMAHHLASNSRDRYEKFRYIIEHILGRPGDEALYQEWVTDFRTLTRQALSRCEFVTGAREFLEHFKPKVPVYLASATPEDELAWILRERKIDHFFKRGYGAPTKKPILIDRILKEEGLTSPTQAVFIGDSPEDRESALKTGVPFVGRRARTRFEGIPEPVFDNMLGVLSYLRTRVS